MTLMLAGFIRVSELLAYSQQTVIGDTFGLFLCRDPLWSKRPIRELKLLKWLTEGSTVFGFTTDRKKNAAPNDNKI